ncbi:type II toxin-antitoxin system RelE family toxin [Candidatus Wolbachia massiliensis]|uniref:Type II toxin-antitoxin system RelE/ParE family toxin n=1 Tax=Candidatus Wolbachia massiliensis TaxID=1845000 RepID=A0A7L7YQ43_9RICK|nr:type II toxin-antitoxin system RelE/ParE family toxin [Candidatus Wolbachia massiliensis]QOD38195.1 type II toxin-antitoxin system RelE/ParE family toxin [Candidatus Wolbachia massiliensis]
MTAKKSGNSLYTIKYLKSIRKDTSAFPKSVKLRIKNAINGRIVTDPISNGETLKGKFKGHWKLKIGSYRIIYRINTAERIVTITSIKHRKESYRKKN